jgi:hypothetical protein
MDAAALFNGPADLSPHSDLKVPHLRNMYEKFGPLFGSHAGSPPDARAGFGYIHNGAIPDMGTFLSHNVFTINAAQVRDLSAFMFAFPTGVKPSVGRHLTVPAGAPPTGTGADESLLATLMAVGDAASPGRHCELTARAERGGVPRGYSWSGGAWIPDATADPPLSTLELRQGATSPVTFLCATLGSGARLGIDRDEDAALDRDDCAAGDPSAAAVPAEVDGVMVDAVTPTRVHWADQSSTSGTGTRYDLLGFTSVGLRTLGLASASCRAADLEEAEFFDGSAAPAPGEVIFYLPRARNACGAGGYGPGRAALDTLSCP